MIKIDKISNQIKKLQDKISDIQSKCKHTHYRIGLYSCRVGNCSKVRICNTCGINLGSALLKEIKQFDLEKNDGQGKKIYKNEYDV